MSDEPWKVFAYTVFNGLVQERCNSNALAMELHHSYTNILICFYYHISCDQMSNIESVCSVQSDLV